MTTIQISLLVVLSALVPFFLGLGGKAQAEPMGPVVVQQELIFEP